MLLERHWGGSCMTVEGGKSDMAKFFNMLKTESHPEQDACSCMLDP